MCFLFVRCWTLVGPCELDRGAVKCTFPLGHRSLWSLFRCCGLVYGGTRWCCGGTRSCCQCYPSSPWPSPANRKLLSLSLCLPVPVRASLGLRTPPPGDLCGDAFPRRQLFEIFDTLNEPSLKRMNSVVNGAVQMCSLVYIMVSSATKRCLSCPLSKLCLKSQIVQETTCAHAQALCVFPSLARSHSSLCQ